MNTCIHTPAYTHTELSAAGAKSMARKDDDRYDLTSKASKEQAMEVCMYV